MEIPTVYIWAIDRSRDAHKKEEEEEEKKLLRLLEGGGRFLNMSWEKKRGRGGWI